MRIRPLNPEKVQGAGRQELPAYLSNGLVGLRVRPNALAAGMALVCGYSGLHPERKIEAMARAPYPLAADVALNGVWLSDVPQCLTVRDQAYDFASGELTTRMIYAAGEARAEIEVLTFCCRHQPTLVAQEIAVRVNTGCDLKLQAAIDTRQIPGRLLRHTYRTPGGERQLFDASLCWESAGPFGRCGIAYATDFDQERETAGGNPGALASQYGFRARAGKIYRLRQIASLVPSILHDQPDRHAERLVALGAHQGFAALRRANRAEWQELWKGRILLHGAGRRWQQLADAAFFYMNASVHAASPASTSIFGLATWHDYHYYYGHVMWDIETFSVPPLIFLQPNAAAALLEYRMRGLEGARNNARGFGRHGLQFPWESAPSSAEEATPSPGKSCWHEDHISLDVALAFAQFCHITGDTNFLAEKAWPVLSGVADWLASRSQRSARGFEIRRCMGIAERQIESDNEAFTMLSAEAVLRETLSAARRLGRAPRPEWEAMAGRMTLPLRGGMLVSHAAFRANEEKAATPSPLMGVFPLASGLGSSIQRKTLDYYLSRADAYIGSPMLSALYGVWAARRGDRALSRRLLERGYGKFVTGRFLQTLEYDPDRFPEQPQAGPFFANMGGFLMSLLLGFPAIEPGAGEPSRWPARKTVLPEGWKAIEVERLWIRGRPAHLLAQQGKRARISVKG